MSARAVFPLTVLLVFWTWSVLWAEPEVTGQPRVEANLVADTAEARAGSTFYLGVRFEIEEGWHIYWRNPGGAGLATAVDFDLPDGCTAGPLQWPLPVTFAQSEGIPGYGYESSVILASETEIATDFDTSQPARVRSEVSWLACKEVCVLGSAELEGSLADLPEDPAFREWLRRLPQTVAEGESPFTVTARGGLDSGRIGYWLQWAIPPRTVEWFPDPSPALEVSDVRVQTRVGLTRIDAAVHRRKGAEGSTATLPSLVVATDEDGVRSGWNLKMNLKDQDD